MKQETKLLIIIGVIALAVIGLGVFFSLSDKSSYELPEKVTGEKKMTREYSYQSNSQNQAKTLVEFADFECPACKQVSPTVEALAAKHPDLNLVIRHFPLAQHRYAKVASYAYEAANMQGKGYDMYKKLYASQDTWTKLSNPQSAFEQIAQELGLNVEKFKSDSSSAEVKKRVAQDSADGLELGVNSTPSFFVNGEILHVNGLVDFEKALGYPTDNAPLLQNSETQTTPQTQTPPTPEAEKK